MNNNIDFDTDFTSDEEVEETIDSIVAAVGERIAADESRTSIINLIKLKQIGFTYKVLKYMTAGSKAKVTYKLNEPYTSVGFVSVVGKDISFNHPEWLLKIAEYASNIEAYPRTDGTVQMNFTFHGLTLPIE